MWEDGTHGIENTLYQVKNHRKVIHHFRPLNPTHYKHLQRH